MGGEGSSFARRPNHVAMRLRHEWGTRFCGEDETEDRQKGEGVATHDGGRGVRQPEERYRNRDGGDGGTPTENGGEEQSEPGGGEELGVGGALVGSVQRVGVGDVD